MEDDQKKKLVVLCALIVVLGAVWYVVLFGMPGGGGGGGQNSGQETASKKTTQTAEKGEGKSAEKSDKKDEKEDRLGPQEVADLLESLHAFQSQKVSSEGKVVRDPFVFKTRPEPPEVDFPELNVTVILSSSGKGTAVINGSAVSEGETLGPEGNMTVTRIKSNSVMVVYSAKGREVEKTVTLE